MAIPLRAVSGKVKSTKCKQPLIFLCDLSQISSPPEPSAAFAVVPTIQRKETPSRSLLFCTLTSLPTAPISDSYPYSASKQLSFFPPASAQSLQPTSRPASAQALPTSAQPYTDTIQRSTHHSPQEHAQNAAIPFSPDSLLAHILPPLQTLSDGSAQTRGLAIGSPCFSVLLLLAVLFLRLYHCKE